MRRYNKVLSCFFLILFSGSLLAMDFNRTLSEHDSDSGSSNTAGSSQSQAKKYEGSSSNASIPESGFVRVSTSLNVRTGPWGTIIGSLYNNNKVKIIGKEGVWYKISHNGKTAYVHSRYVSSSKGNASSSGSPLVTVPAKGSVQQKVVAAAQNLVNKYKTSGSFPYAAATRGGALGCAQVVTTALKAAGVNTGIQLGVLATIPKLKSLGWKQVKVPPYQAGDVITWSTYDRNRDGRNDADTHIGIIMTSGNTAQAMSNSSTRRRPSLHSATYMPVCKVLRKA